MLAKINMLLIITEVCSVMLLLNRLFVSFNSHKEIPYNERALIYPPSS